MQAYLKELWTYTADRLRVEVETLCATRGVDAVLALIQETAFGPDASPPPFVGSPAKYRFAVASENLESFDFQRWFRALQLVRMIPYVVTKFPSSETNAKGVRMILSLISDHPDVIMRRCAAAAFNNTDSFTYPAFHVARADSGKPFALLFRFAHADRARGGEPLAYRLLPLVADDRFVAEQMAGLMSREVDVGVRSSLIEASVGMSNASAFQLAYLRIAGDPSAPDWLREDALKRLDPSASSPQLRTVFEAAIANVPQNVGDRYAQLMFLDHVAEYFPRDARMCDQIAGIVSNHEADSGLKTAAVGALLQYYDQGLRTSAMSVGIARLIADVGLDGEIEKFSEICQLVAEHRFVESEATFLELRRRLLESSPAPKDLEKRIQNVERTITSLREAQK